MNLKNAPCRNSTTPKPRLMDALWFLALLCIVFYALVRGSVQDGYLWQWYRIPKYFGLFEGGRFVPGPILNGLSVTLQITLVSLFAAMAVGLATALLRLSRSWIGRSLSRIYLETIRNTPLLVQLFFIYFVLLPILDMNRFGAAVVALSLFEGAYASEIFRAAILSIPKGQWEAAHSLGLNRYQSYRHVILPQGVRKMLPPLTGQAVSLIKDSALVSTIAVYDLTMRAQEIIAETYLAFEVWFAVAAVYLVLTLTLSGGVYLMEKRLHAS